MLSASRVSPQPPLALISEEKSESSGRGDLVDKMGSQIGKSPRQKQEKNYVFFPIRIPPRNRLWVSPHEHRAAAHTLPGHDSEARGWRARGSPCGLRGAAGPGAQAPRALGASRPAPLSGPRTPRGPQRGTRRPPRLALPGPAVGKAVSGAESTSLLPTRGARTRAPPAAGPIGAAGPPRLASPAPLPGLREPPPPPRSRGEAPPSSLQRELRPRAREHPPPAGPGARETLTSDVRALPPAGGGGRAGKRTQGRPARTSLRRTRRGLEPSRERPPPPPRKGGLYRPAADLQPRALPPAPPTCPALP